MKEPSFYSAFQVLLLQLADEGRAEALLGDCISRVRSVSEPFFVGREFPSVYLEFPLMGDPYLDVTMLYSTIAPGTSVDAEAAEGTKPIFDWFAGVCDEDSNICFGFELDTSKPQLPRAAVHFQPRANTELVEPFFEAAGEPERAKLYLDLAKRMPRGWPLSFFGMFRGRPGSPLRVCGYLGDEEKRACAGDPAHLASALDAIGFTAYDGAMLDGISQALAVAPGTVDFQFDVYPDGSLGEVFALDIQFEIEQPAVVRESFESGAASRVVELLEKWGVADGRWRLAVDAAFARSLPAEREDGTLGKFGFTLFPQWTKIRWRAGVLQPAKLYYLAKAGFTK